ncbi:MAG: uracil-DNA glycosylase family protein [Bacteroidales bacterium]|nr:uracil-DNA glycosylase family protein [Bacteroidales bacterium]
MVIESHPFQPFLPDGARILFLGSFPPPAHRWSIPFYYPNWINDFWRIMGLIHFGDKNHFCIISEKMFDEDAIRAFCAQAGLAFYDTACEVRRLKDNASDAFLEVVTPTDISAILSQTPDCDTLVTTGRKATEVLAEQLCRKIPAIGEYVEISHEQANVHNNMGNHQDRRGPGNEICNRTVRFWRMPSTSRAYPLPLEKKAEIYRRLFM